MNARIIVAPAVHQITLEPYSLPAIGPDEVLVETQSSMISPGTELAWLHHKPNTPGIYPYYPGYAAVATILETGDSVENLTVGQRVACRIRHASHFVLKAAGCTPLPDGLSDAEGAAFTLVSIALQGVHKAQIQLGWSVAVLGLGPIGNLAGQIARAAGATHVLGIDPIPWRRDLALQCGFDAVADPEAGTLPADQFGAVIEATGVPEAVLSAFQLAKRLGHVVLLASTRGNVPEVNFYRDVHKKGLTVIGAHDSIRPNTDDYRHYISRPTDDATSLRLISSGRVQIAPLISDIVHPADAPSAYERLNKREEPVMLIGFQWQE